MSNLLVKHSRSLSPAKLLYREYGGTPIATKFRPCCEGESLNRNPPFRRGAALRSGFAAATGDMVLVQDADVEYNPEDYPAFLEPLMSGKADAASRSFLLAYGR